MTADCARPQLNRQTCSLTLPLVAAALNRLPNPQQPRIIIQNEDGSGTTVTVTLKEPLLSQNSPNHGYKQKTIYRSWYCSL